MQYADTIVFMRTRYFNWSIKSPMLGRVIIDRNVIVKTMEK